jgi:hypothetical protein
LRSFLGIASAWQLQATSSNKAGDVSVLWYDMPMRISLVLGIYKDLHIRYPEPDLADRWVTHKSCGSPTAAAWSPVCTQPSTRRGRL